MPQALAQPLGMALSALPSMQQVTSRDFIWTATEQLMALSAQPAEPSRTLTRREPVQLQPRELSLSVSIRVGTT